MDGKVIAITGGASGMGLALARVLAARNANLSISDMNEKGLAAIEAELKEEHPNYLYTKVNIAVEKEVTDWISATKSHFGRLDGAANCAGIVGTTNTAMPLTQIENSNWDKCIAVNLTGKCYLPRFKATICPQACMRGHPSSDLYFFQATCTASARSCRVSVTVAVSSQ